MQKYHINPETGRANICRAVKNCAFSNNGESVEHYDSKEEAQSAFEKQNSKKTINSIEKRTVIVPATKEEKSQKLDQKIDEMIDDLSHEERQKLLTHIAGLKRDEKKKEFNKKLDQLMVDEKYYGTVFHHRGKVVNEERTSKEEYHKFKEERDRQRKAEREARISQEQKNRNSAKVAASTRKKVSAIEDLEKLEEKLEELKSDKKQVRKYIRTLETRAHLASSIQRYSEEIRKNSTEENRHSAHLGVEDAEMFERDINQEEYKTLLELRAELRKRIKRNPFSIIKNTSANMRGVITEEYSVIREINQRLHAIYDRSYRWRFSKETKQQWEEFYSSVSHLLDEHEK